RRVLFRSAIRIAIARIKIKGIIQDSNKVGVITKPGRMINISVASNRIRVSKADQGFSRNSSKEASRLRVGSNGARERKVVLRVKIGTSKEVNKIKAIKVKTGITKGINNTVKALKVKTGMTSKDASSREDLKARTAIEIPASNKTPGDVMVKPMVEINKESREEKVAKMMIAATEGFDLSHKPVKTTM